MEMGKRHVVSKNAVINWGYHIFRIRCKINPCFVCVIELKGSIMVKKIMRDPLFLAQKSVDATEADKQVITDLLDTLRANLDHCVGMAANMIGVKKRIIIVNAGFRDIIMFNPVIVRKSGPYETEEGCLSLPGVRKTKRYQNIEIEYYDWDWKKQRQKFIGWPAQICQHEMDHLEGILI